MTGQPDQSALFDSIECPRCKAGPGIPCVWTSGAVPIPHSAHGLEFIRAADEKRAAVRTHDSHDDSSRCADDTPADPPV